ncbi:hypothetical protein BH09PSE2_BH09PSE2_17700 [soil metagenome]
MPGWFSASLIVLASVAATELFAWAAHRFVMHSPLGWGLHSTHHSESNRMGSGGGWEWNDLYAVIFAAPAILLFWIGRDPALKWAFWAGLGVTIYGVLYALVHDGLVHGRGPFRFTPRGGYAKRLVQAHRLHHATRGRTGSVSFGFLYAPDVRLLKARLKAKGSAGRA